jgi:hypothetical protein
MPYMVRRIADSAGVPEMYRIRMHAPGGVRFEDHWRNPDVHALLAQPWRDVVLQGRSNEQQNHTVNASFHNYGARLIAAAKAAGAQPVLYISWRYGEDSDFYREIPELKERLHYLMQENYYRLAVDNGVTTVNVGAAWEQLLAYKPGFSLYADGNHPTVHGSYLAALMFYRYFSGDKSLARAAYIPPGVAPEEAEMIKRAVREGKDY